MQKLRFQKSEKWKKEKETEKREPLSSETKAPDPVPSQEKNPKKRKRYPLRKEQSQPNACPTQPIRMYTPK
jgi:hypothetical protein